MPIFECHSKLRSLLLREADLRTHIPDAFRLAKESHAKVALISQLLDKYALFPAIEPLRAAKDNKLSADFRQIGNRKYAKKDFKGALIAYNQSLCYAEVGSECLAFAYANRSAVFFEMGMHRVCLENIELAERAGYPESGMVKLTQRKKQCHLRDNKTELKGENLELFALKSPHESVPFILDCLEMVENDQLGRHIVTKRRLSPGDIIAVEKPFCTIAYPHMRYQRCATCLKEHSHSLLPCLNCTNTMFCSVDCHDRGQIDFHQIECPINDCVQRIFTKIHLMSLRTVTAAISKFDSVGELMRYVNGRHINTVFDQHDPMDNREIYCTIHNLATNESLRNVNDLLQRATFGAVLSRIVLNHSPLRDRVVDQEEQNFVVDLIFRHLQTTPTNMHTLSTVEYQTDIPDDINYGSGAFGFCSLINHSCSPNIIRVTYNSMLVVIALRPISEGGQLYDNYGFHHCLQPHLERQTALKDQYNFQCGCEACNLRYPTFSNLKSGELPMVVSNEDIASLSAFDYQFAKNAVEKYCKFLEQYDASYPCVELSSAQESLKMSYGILTGNVPMFVDKFK